MTRSMFRDRRRLQHELALSFSCTLGSVLDGLGAGTVMGRVVSYELVRYGGVPLNKN